MSKIKINEVESLSSNGDLELTPNGTGVVEIKSDETDGALQLNSTENNSKTKIKSPPSTAAQDYTLILPDNQIAQDKYLQVASVTGSGSTAVGQLQYATVTPPNTNLDAAQVTNGVLDAARLPSPLPATAGLGLKHVSTTTTTSQVYSVEVQNLEVDSVYRIVVRNLHYNGTSTRTNIRFLDTSNVEFNSSYSPPAYYNAIRYYSYGYNPGGYTNRFQQSDIQIDGDGSGSNHYALGFVADLFTGTTTNMIAAGIHIKATRPYNSNAFNAYTNAKLYAPSVHGPIGGFKIYNAIGYNFNTGFQISVYKYMEA